MNKNSPIIGVIMSTYNGEKYLKEQIDSILKQENVEVRLFIRDDGSHDKTADIINAYAEKYENIVFWNKENVVNLGIRDSFLTLLKNVFDSNSDIEYFSFADQDDVWKPHKLAAAVEKIEAKTKKEYKEALYYSNKTFVDADLNFISEENIKYYGDFFEILWPSLASGCTMVMNRAMVSLSVCKMPEYYSSIHDAWVYRLAVLCGAIIVFDPVSYILYRQHGNNARGQDFTSIINKKWFLHLMSKQHFSIQTQFKEFLRLHKEDISQDNCKYVDWVMNYHKSLSAFWHLATSSLARKRGFLLYGAWLVKLLIRRI